MNAFVAQAGAPSIAIEARLTPAPGEKIPLEESLRKKDGSIEIGQGRQNRHLRPLMIPFNSRINTKINTSSPWPKATSIRQ